MMDLSISSRGALGPPTEESKSQDDSDLRPSAVTTHTEAVQALRKYLLRKMSSEESSGDKELEGTPGRVISVAEEDGSKLYCRVVPITKPTTEAVQEVAKHQGNSCTKRGLAKHKSLDLDDNSYGPPEPRYLRTDLCVPVLWSKCSFCEDFFEDEENLRQHLRDSHFQYFLNYIQMRPLTSTKSLSDFSSALQISDSPPPTKHETDYVHGSKSGLYARKPVKCQVCQKSFTTKWNCKQHSKCHTKESSSSSVVMDTDSSNAPSPLSGSGM